MHTNGEECKECPTNAMCPGGSDGFYCNRGYEKNEDEDACEKVTCPADITKLNKKESCEECDGDFDGSKDDGKKCTEKSTR